MDLLRRGEGGDQLSPSGLPEMMNDRGMVRAGLRSNSTMASKAQARARSLLNLMCRKSK